MMMMLKRTVNLMASIVQMNKLKFRIMALHSTCTYEIVMCNINYNNFMLNIYVN
jgi:hypothetical protein